MKKLEGTENIQKLKGKINAAFTAVKGMCIALAAVIAALVIFAAFCAGMGWKETHPTAVLSGLVVFGLLGIVLVLGLCASIFIAYYYLNRLKRFPDEGNTDEENA